jgi:hypothetical protein
MKLFKKELHMTGSDSADSARSRWKERNPSPTVGKPHFVRTADSKEQNLLLFYHHSFGKDMCDTMFTGEILPNDGGCQLHGYITVTPRMRLFAWIMLIAAAVAGFLTLLFFPLRIAFIVWGGGIVLFFVTHQVTKQRANAITDYLQTFINIPESDEESSI